MVLYILRVRPAFHTSWMKLAQRNTHRVKENWRCTGAARVVFAFKPCDRSGRNAFFLSPDVSRADQESTLAWCGIGPTVLPLLDSQTPLARHSSTGGIQPRIYSLLIIPRNYARNGKRLRFRQSGGNRRYSGEYPPPRRIFVSFGSNIYIYIYISVVRFVVGDNTLPLMKFSIGSLELASETERLNFVQKFWDMNQVSAIFSFSFLFFFSDKLILCNLVFSDCSRVNYLYLLQFHLLWKEQRKTCAKLCTGMLTV